MSKAVAAPGGGDDWLQLAKRLLQGAEKVESVAGKVGLIAGAAAVAIAWFIRRGGSSAT
jgi:hypothetical protein